ncbi:MAG: type 1 glutamine amidotransferase [Gammaproteobacteria bacterium]
MTRRLGLLACDTIWQPLRSRHGDYADMIAHWLTAAGADFELHVWAAHEGDLPAHVDDCDAWLVSGSRAGVYEALPWMASLLDWVRGVYAAGRPQLGICFGHQLLAEALGGRTLRAPAGWGIGNVVLRLRATTAGAPTREALSLYMAHQDQVVTLPPGATWLAETEHCAHAMFAMGDRVLGLQAHPEFTADFMREMTCEDAFPLRPEHRAAALASYDAPVDATAAGRWAAAFLGLDCGRPARD